MINQATSSTFEPVWISTEAHLDQFKGIADAASFFEKALGLYNIPEGFPRITLLPLIRVAMVCPVVIKANGRLLVEAGRLTFDACPPAKLAKRLSGLDENLTFSISRDEVLSLNDYEMSQALIDYYGLPFMRLTTIQKGITSNFLVCVGGWGLWMGKIKAENQVFREALTDWFHQYDSDPNKTHSRY